MITQVMAASMATEAGDMSSMALLPSQEKREFSTMLQLPAIIPVLRIKLSTDCVMACSVQAENSKIPSAAGRLLQCLGLWCKANQQDSGTEKSVTLTIYDVPIHCNNAHTADS